MRNRCDDASQDSASAAQACADRDGPAGREIG